MNNTDSKLINSILHDELLHLWDSGLGKCFCENNKNDIDVLSLKNNAMFFETKGHKTKTSAFLWFAVLILIFLGIYSTTELVDMSNGVVLAIISGVVCAGIFLGGAVRLVKSRKLFEAANKLRNFDLSGFDIEDNVPVKRRVMRKSVEWGLVENKLTIQEGKITPVTTACHAETAVPQSAANG